MKSEATVVFPPLSWKIQMRTYAEKYHVSFDIKSALANRQIKYMWVCVPSHSGCDLENLPGVFWGIFLKNWGRRLHTLHLSSSFVIHILFCFVFHWGIMIFILWALWWMPSAILSSELVAVKSNCMKVAQKQRWIIGTNGNSILDVPAKF